MLMRMLESAPHRYDVAMRMLTFGGIDRAYDELAAHVTRGQRVLDIGCGTGALTLRLALRGAQVRGIDVNPEMLAIARRRLEGAGIAEDVELAETGVAELDNEPSGSYDVIVSGLCLSELTDDERSYTLSQAQSLLKEGGWLAVADEIVPGNLALRALNAAIRAPLVALTYLVTQQTTHAVRSLPEELAGAGFRLVSQRERMLGTFGVFIAEKPKWAGA